MAEVCKLAPTVSRRVGVKIEEIPSELFKDIKDAVGDYDTAWNLWAYTKTSDFKERHPNVAYDELGEVTFPSLIKALGIEDQYKDLRKIESAAKDYGFDKTIYQNPESAASDAERFNTNEKKFIAVVSKDKDGYKVNLLPRSAMSIEEAKTQTYNRALSKEIVSLLEELGFGVEFVNDPKFNGLFDPTSTKMQDGLLMLIRIAKGEVGEGALPEEFSHLIIEGLIKHPLVARLLETIDIDVAQRILGDSFEQYQKEYGNDSWKLRKEAAGKLLAEHINSKGTIFAPIVQQRKSLLSRIWNWVKGVFSKVSNSHIDEMCDRAYDSVEQIYGLIASKRVVRLLDKVQVTSGDTLYQLPEEYNTAEKVGVKAEVLLGKKVQSMKLKGTASGKSYSDTVLALQNTQKLMDREGDMKPVQAIQTFLKDVKAQLILLQKKVNVAEKLEREGKLDNIHAINTAAKLAREIDEITLGYSDIIKVIASFGAESENDDNTLGISADDAKALAMGENGAASVKSLLDRLGIWRQSASRNILMAAARTVYTEDKVRGIGSKRDEVMALAQIIDHAGRDINIIDRWFTAMSDADDPMLTIMDSIVKTQQYERDMEMIGIRAEIAKLDEDLRKAGFTSEFIYERDEEGNPTMRIISPYDWDAYNAARKKYSEFLLKKGITGKMYRKRMRAWKENREKVPGIARKQPRLIKIYVDPAEQAKADRGEKVSEDAVFEMVPNPVVFPAKVHTIENLAPAQRTYYNEVMRIKREMMTKIPHRGQGIYQVIYTQKDLIEGITDNNIEDAANIMKENFKKKFVRRAGDIGFGTDENFGEDILNILKNTSDPEKAATQVLTYISMATDEDIVTFIPNRVIEKIIRNNNKDLEKARDMILDRLESENFYTVQTDFANHRIQRLPIYYTRPPRDHRMLSTDFSGALVAYSAMCVNYEKMSEVVDILEVGKDWVNNFRDIQETEGDKPVRTRLRLYNGSYDSAVVSPAAASNIAARYNDFMSSVVYEERKKDEGSIPIVNLDFGKTIDTIKDYTGLLGLGLNLFSTVSNIAVGKLQQWIEAAGGEYFNLKDYALACKQYTELLPGHIAEIGNPVKKNKLSLLIQMFDPMGEYFENLRDPNMQKNRVARILGNGALAYIGMNAGEHVLHCQTMLAILNHVKVIDSSTGEKISLFDALEVVENDKGITELKLKEGLSYERDLVDTDKHSKNFGKPLRDENGKIKKEKIDLKGREMSRFLMRQKRIIRKVNDSLNGAFNANDKGAIHKYALGRLIMQFRQWMPAHYMRRFARAHYDADLEQWREGYYNTVLSFTNALWKDLKKGQLEIAKVYGTLSEHEQANLRRATAEIGEFLSLMLLVKMGGRVRDRDRSWLDKMVLYQINRMYLEVGASMPMNFGFFSNILQLLQSPAASIKTFEKFGNLLRFQNMLDEIETGRYQGMSEWERDVLQFVPAFDQIFKAVAFDDSMFSMYEKD